MNYITANAAVVSGTGEEFELIKIQAYSFMGWKPPKEPEKAVTEAHAWAAVEKILESKEFEQAKTLRKLLEFIAKATLSGTRLKEYAIAIDVFEKPVTFDGRINSIVRMGCRQLRAKLDKYYAGSGADDPVVISIPKGKYKTLCRYRIFQSPKLLAGQLRLWLDFAAVIVADDLAPSEKRQLLEAVLAGADHLSVPALSRICRTMIAELVGAVRQETPAA